jgi:hypothetical protein
MNPDESNIPWLEYDEWEGEDGLLGNRQGFELLRDGIDRILTRTENTVPLNDAEITVRVLRLGKRPPAPLPETIGDKLGNLVLATILLSIPLLAAFGLVQLISILFH